MISCGLWVIVLIVSVAYYTIEMYQAPTNMIESKLKQKILLLLCGMLPIPIALLLDIGHNSIGFGIFLLSLVLSLVVFLWIGMSVSNQVLQYVYFTAWAIYGVCATLLFAVMISNLFENV